MGRKLRKHKRLIAAIVAGFLAFVLIFSIFAVAMPGIF